MLETMDTSNMVIVERWLTGLDQSEERIAEISLPGEEELPLPVTIGDPSSVDPGSASLIPMNIYAYPQAMSVFRDEDDYYEQSQSRMAPESIIPSGMFPAGGRPDPEFRYESRAIIHGTVKLAEEHRWSSGEPFYAILIQSLGCQINVFADPNRFQQLPQPGNILAGEFFLEAEVDRP